MTTKKFDLLGKAVNKAPASPSEAQIDVFLNKQTKRHKVVSFDCSDFTSRCPVTDQSDFAQIYIRYIPDEQCIETKSLKYYLQSFRDQKMFNEEIVNRILSDLVQACAPKWMQVKGKFAARGGISLSTIAEYPDINIDQVRMKLE